MAVACLSLILPLGASAGPNRFEPERVLVSWGLEAPPKALSSSLLLARAQSSSPPWTTIWALEPTSLELLRLDLASERIVVDQPVEQARETPLSTERRVEFAAGAVKITRSPLSFLPKAEPGRGGAARDWILAPASETTVWLVDGAARQAWRLDRSRWSDVVRLGEAVDWAVSPADGTLVLSIPEHGLSSFGVVGSTGKVERRFGTSIELPHPSLSREANRWVTAVLNNGDLVALHRFRPVARRYAADGEVLWERQLASPAVERLSPLRARAEAWIEADANSQCVACRLIHHATFAQSDGTGGFWARFGNEPALERFDQAGSWIDRIEIAPRSTGPWQTAGLAVAGNYLIAAEPQGVVLYSLASAPASVAGEIETRDSVPVPEAKITARTTAGIERSAVSDHDGRFVVKGIAGLDSGTLDISAGGFQEKRLSGRFEALVAEPLVLDRALEQCVVVRDASTLAPVASFTLTLVRNRLDTESAERLGGPRREVAETNAGRACLEAPWPPPWIVEVEAEGYARNESRVAEVIDQPPLEITLAPEARLRVNIEDPEGEPVVGARVLLLSETTADRSARAFSASQTALSDESGSAQLGGIEPGDHQIDILHADHLEARSGFRLDPGDNHHTVHLARGSQVEVQVRSTTGARLATARVRLSGNRKVSQPTACMTEADGVCRLVGVPPGRWEVRATATGYTSARRTLVVGSGETSHSLELVLSRGVQLTGTVLGVEHYPHLSFDVVLVASSVPLMPAPVDRTGGFAFSEAPATAVDLLVAERRSGSAFLQEEVIIPDDVTDFDVTLELPEPQRLSGRVTHGARGCGACTITFEQQGADVVRALLQASTGAEGGYSLALPATGTYSVRIRDRDSGRSLTDVIVVFGDGELNFSLGELELKGRVLSATGKAVAGAKVDLDDATTGQRLGDTVTGELGAFRFEGLSERAYRVSASDSRNAVSQIITVAPADSEGIDLYLPATATLRLQLYDEASRFSVSQASVLLQSSTGDVARHPRLVADEGGIVSIPAFEAESHVVVVSAPGYALKTLRDLRPSPSPVPTALHHDYRSFNVEVAPAAGEPCAFELVGSDGRSVALSSELLPGPVPYTRRRSFFNGLEPGTYTAILYSCDGRQHAQPLHLAAGSPTLRFPPP